MLQAKPELSYKATMLTIDEAVRQAGAEQRVKYLQEQLKPLACRIPPVLQSYLSVGNAIWFDDAALDHDFGGAYEQSIIVPLAALSNSFRQRFLDCHL